MAKSNSNALAWNHRWWRSETTDEACGETIQLWDNCSETPWACGWNFRNAGSCKRKVQGKSQSNSAMKVVEPCQADEVKWWCQFTDIALAKCQTYENTQSKMPRIQLVVLDSRPTHSKMPMKSGARYSRCGADVALQQRGTSGTADRKIFYKLLCSRQQWFWRDRLANALLSQDIGQEIGSMRPWLQDLCDGSTCFRKLLNDFQVVVEQTELPADHWTKCCKLPLWTRPLSRDQDQLHRKTALPCSVNHFLQVSKRRHKVVANHQMDPAFRLLAQVAQLSQRSHVPVRNLPVRVHSFSAPSRKAVGVKHLVPIQHNCRSWQLRDVLLNFDQRGLVSRPQIWFHTRMQPCWSKMRTTKTKGLRKLAEALGKEMPCTTEVLRNDTGQRQTMMLLPGHQTRPRLWSLAVLRGRCPRRIGLIGLADVDTARLFPLP